jgi:hypothetical protein
LGLRSLFGVSACAGLTRPTRSRAMARTSLGALNFFGRFAMSHIIFRYAVLSPMYLARIMVALISAASAFAAAPPSGVWQCLLPAYDRSLHPFVFTLKAGEGAVTGSIKGEIYDGVASPDIAIFDGTTDGTLVTFFARIPVHGGVRLTRYTGKLLDEATMDLRIVRADGRRPPDTCTAKRVGD